MITTTMHGMNHIKNDSAGVRSFSCGFTFNWKRESLSVQLCLRRKLETSSHNSYLQLFLLYLRQLCDLFRETGYLEVTLCRRLNPLLTVLIDPRSIDVWAINLLTRNRKWLSSLSCLACCVPREILINFNHWQLFKIPQDKSTNR